MITNLLLQSGLPVACLEYRLAPDDPHPSQALDVLSGLSLLTGPLLPLEHSTPRWDRSKLYLIGHSVGAFIATSIILNSPFPNPSFIVPPTLRSCIKGVVCVDGIYDLPELLDEYPSYDFFVNLAFGKDPLVFIHESPARWDLPVESGDVRWLVLHSREDELLSLRQPEVFVKRMKEVGGEGRLEVDYESVKGEHEAVWKEEILPRVIVEWVRKLEGMK
jgi:acetyl esterase/lipase